MPENSVEGRSVLVTGATGFLGSHVSTELRKKKASVFGVSRVSGFDLTREGAAYEAFAVSRPDVAIHLAATVGGIGANQRSPARFIEENLRMGLLVCRAALIARCPLVVAGTVCSYPRDAKPPFLEEKLWDGYPEETNAPYGIAKKAILSLCEAYGREYGWRSVHLLPSNLYGPGDDFRPATSHVIPALLRRFLEASEKGDPVTVWGTGSATRSFLFVRDAAQAIVRATGRLLSEEPMPSPINLPGCAETSIESVASLIAEHTGYKGAIYWDSQKPDGQPRRALDGTRALETLGWSPTTSLGDGLKETVEWYRRNPSA